MSSEKKELTHLNERGHVHMVDVGEKSTTERRARAVGLVRMRPETARLIAEGGASKGEVLATARVAGIMAAKRTAELIPLCHAVALTHVSLELAVDTEASTVEVTAEATARDRTGVEMEALAAVSVACLTVYDMLKAKDREMVIDNVRLLEKAGGRSGHFVRSAESAIEIEPEAASSGRIRAQAISVDELVGRVAHSGAGGIATFVGVVRDLNDGHCVTRLDYEAYVPMAEEELSKILSELSAKFPECRVEAFHRIGQMTVGDVAVACVASAPHRNEAFVACRQLIDEIKARLPIWKREYGPDGAHWLEWRDARCHPDHQHNT